MRLLLLQLLSFCLMVAPCLELNSCVIDGILQPFGTFIYSGDLHWMHAHSRQLKKATKQFWLPDQFLNVLLKALHCPFLKVFNKLYSDHFLSDIFYQQSSKHNVYLKVRVGINHLQVTNQIIRFINVYWPSE